MGAIVVSVTDSLPGKSKVALWPPLTTGHSPKSAYFRLKWLGSLWVFNFNPPAFYSVGFGPRVSFVTAP
jgi:hypothetical protein